MTRNTRKGFTGIELVIVIAIIAILATALIPAFGGLIDSANKTADKQLAKNLNTALLLHNINSDVDDFSDVLDAARKEGYLISNLNPTSNGCYLVWESDSNQFLLVDAEEEYEVLFAADPGYTAKGTTWHFVTSDVEAAAALRAAGFEVAMAVTSTSDLTAAVATGNGETIYLDESIVVDVNNVIKLDKAGGSITIDLGSNSVTGGSTDTSAAAFPFSATAGTLNLKGGVISATGAFIDADGKTGYAALSAKGGVVNVEDTVVSIDATQNYCFSYGSGSTGTVRNVTFNIPNVRQAVGIFTGAKVRVEDCNVNAFAELVFCSTSGGAGSAVTIDGGNYHTKRELICVYGGEVTIEDGVFTCDDAGTTFQVYGYQNGTIILKGGTFNGVRFENLTEDTIRGMCSRATAKIVNENGAWIISVK